MISPVSPPSHIALTYPRLWQRRQAQASPCRSPTLATGTPQPLPAGHPFVGLSTMEKKQARKGAHSEFANNIRVIVFERKSRIPRSHVIASHNLQAYRTPTNGIVYMQQNCTEGDRIIHRTLPVKPRTRAGQVHRTKLNMTWPGCGKSHLAHALGQIV